MVSLGLAMSGTSVSPVNAVGTINVTGCPAPDGGPIRVAMLQVLVSCTRGRCVSHFASSIRTMSEFSRVRSNTIAFPSGVMSNVCIRPRSPRWVS